MSSRGAGRRKEPFVLEGCDHILVATAAVLGALRNIENVVARGRNDGSHVFRHQFIFHLVIDGPGGTDLGAHAAFALDELAAGGRVDHRFFGDGLGEGDVDGSGEANAFVEAVGCLFTRTFFGAGPAAGAQLPVDVGGLLAHFDLEVADVARDLGYLRVRHELDVGMLRHVDHLGAEDTTGAIHRGKGLVELRHLAADGGLALDQHHFDAALGAVQGRLDAGYPAAQDHDSLGDVEFIGKRGAHSS